MYTYEDQQTEWGSAYRKLGNKTRIHIDGVSNNPIFPCFLPIIQVHLSVNQNYRLHTSVSPMQEGAAF